MPIPKLIRASHIFFDLDGTLTDSAPGITACIRFAASELGFEALDPEAIRPLIGTPLTQIFPLAVPKLPDRQIDAAIAHYRHRFDREGYAENRLYPGVRRTLEQLSGAGLQLHLATAKAQVDAERVVDHFGLGEFFSEVFGVVCDEERLDKRRLLERAIATTAAPANSSVMIGDRHHDMIAGQHVGAHVIAAAWGYGARSELEACAPSRIADRPESLLAILLGQAAAVTTETAPKGP